MIRTAYARIHGARYEHALIVLEALYAATLCPAIFRETLAELFDEAQQLLEQRETAGLEKSGNEAVWKLIRELVAGAEDTRSPMRALEQHAEQLEVLLLELGHLTSAKWSALEQLVRGDELGREAQLEAVVLGQEWTD